LLLTTKKDALVIPAAAIQRGPAGAIVYVVGDGDVVAARPIEIERTEGENAIVRKGVSPGDRVVVDGQSQLKPGSKVAARGPDDAKKP
jgi:multidrug efflux system membrane fusion protein